jgi:hypothetical protein
VVQRVGANMWAAVLLGGQGDGHAS